MVSFEVPNAETMESVNNVAEADLPQFTEVTRYRDPPILNDVETAARKAICNIPALAELPSGADVALTAGSRGIEDMPPLLAAAIDEMKQMELSPFILPAMGSHGGATAEGQTEMLASYDITPETMDCEIRAKMSVERVDDDPDGRPIFASTVAMDADAVVLANRIKLHTDYKGEVESGLHKMAVVGLGKQRGAEAMHNAALDRGLKTVIPERGRILFEETPIVGGIALLENADHRAAQIEGIPVGEIPKREPELLKQSEELFPGLPVDHLDLLIVDEIGKDISGTGMDTNVLGRFLFDGMPEPETPAVKRVAIRGISEASHGNGFGMGLADYAHERFGEELELEDVYINIVTSGEPARARIPILVPSDRTILILATSMTGVQSPDELRVARIQNTLEPDHMFVSEPVADELAERVDCDVGEPEPLTFDENGDFEANFD